jgi:NADPH:quinone reductase-like Zn-dependent oxidoreductase
MNKQREAGGRAWQMAKAGSMDRLLKVETTIAEPDDSSVLVAVKAIGLNFADIFAMLGIYSATPKGTFIPGLEFSGEVLRVAKV